MNGDGSFKTNEYGLWFYPSYYGKKKYEEWLKITPKQLIKLYHDGLPLSEIGKIYDVNRSEVKRVFSLIDIPSRLKRKPLVKKDVPQEWFVGNSSVGYVLGAIMGDGCLAGGNEIRLKVTDADFKERFIEAMLDCGIVREDIKEFLVEAHDNCKLQYGVSVFNKKLVDYIYNNPTFIFKLSDEAKVEFVNGFIDAEGSAEIDNSVTITNTDKWLIDIVDEILNENMIEHTIRVEKRSGKLKDCYRMYIRRKSLERFHEIFRFSIGRKQDRLDKIVEIRRNKKRQREIKKEMKDVRKAEELMIADDKEVGNMEIVTKKFIRCPHCSKLIPVRGRKLSDNARRKISTGVKKAWGKRHNNAEKAGS